jgi:hypothetical protein
MPLRRGKCFWVIRQLGSFGVSGEFKMAKWPNFLFLMKIVTEGA